MIMAMAMATPSLPQKIFNMHLHLHQLLIRFLMMLLFYFAFTTTGMAFAFDTSMCTSPLGMESFDIKDADLSASSSFDTGNVGPQNARVRIERQGGAWCPKNQVTADAEEWLQIDLHTVHVITATETQGRFGNGQGQEYTEKYILSYWRPELGKWVRYKDSTGNEILKANINTYLSVKTELTPPIFASKLRFLPYSIHRRTVCLRVEIYGCPFRGGLASYTMTQGSKRGDNWNFYDQTYDGIWEGNLLRNGLGLLVDGRGGPDNFKDDFYGNERGKGWVGWKNDSRHSSNPVELIFKFDSVREFSAVHIHTSNQFTKDVQVFSEARVYFSIGGRIYPGDPITFITMEDCIFETPKNITINLHHRVGSYVKIQLFWATKWILISEVTFDSRSAMGNFTPESPTTTTTLNPAHTLHEESQSVSNHGGNGNGINIQQTQSDASDLAEQHYHQDTSKIAGQQQHHPSLPNTSSPTSNTAGWSVATIIMTAVISSFVAILMVLLFILTTLVLRNKLNGAAKSVSSNQVHHHLIGTLPYQTVGLGPDCYVTPKCQITTTLRNAVGQEYQEPFATSTSTNNPGSATATTAAGAGTFGGFPGASQTVVAATTMKTNGKLTEYYSCSLVPNNAMPSNITDSSNEYEYAVPNEIGKLLPNELEILSPQSVPNSPALQLASNTSRQLRPNHNNLSNASTAVQIKFCELGIREIPQQRLRMLRKLGNGAFGTVYIGEIENHSPNEKNSLVAVKHLLRNATEKDKVDFVEEIRLLAALNDPNVAQVLGLCTEEEPFSVVLEFLELGDLSQFLRQNDALLPSSPQKLSSPSLLYLASQIASGMCFLERRNIVHRDLATRNCIVGHGLLVKISHFATDTDLYSSHYYRLDGKMPLPVRWMAWESLFLGKYSTKSDIWSFGITLWEILSFARHMPYSSMTNQEVLNNLRRLSLYDDCNVDPFEPLPKPHDCPRDIYQLLCDTWKRNDEIRPSFWEVKSFLTRKNLNFVPPPSATTALNGVSSSGLNNVLTPSGTILYQV